MFKIEVETTGGAFAEDPTGEIARVLEHVRTEIVDYGITGGTIRDANGNRCGTWTFDE